MAEKKQDQDVDAMLDRLLEGRSPEEVVGSGGLLEDLTKRLLERALEGELSDHLGYEKHDARGRDGGNSRSGRTRKRVKTDTAEMEIEVPRDRDGSFEPKLVPKGQRRLPGFDEKVIALYARGMTTREIQEHARRTVDAATRRVRRTNQLQQSLVFLGPRAHRLVHPGVEAAGRDLQDPTHRPHLELGPVSVDERVPYSDPLAKYAAAFFKMSRSSCVRRSSARSVRFSRFASRGSSARSSSRLGTTAFRQLYRLASEIPRRAATSFTV